MAPPRPSTSLSFLPSPWPWADRTQVFPGHLRALSPRALQLSWWCWQLQTPQGPPTVSPCSAPGAGPLCWLTLLPRAPFGGQRARPARKEETRCGLGPGGIFPAHFGGPGATE